MCRLRQLEDGIWLLKKIVVQLAWDFDAQRVAPSNSLALAAILTGSVGGPPLTRPLPLRYGNLLVRGVGAGYCRYWE